MKIYRNVFFLFIIFSLFVYLPIGCGSGGGGNKDKSQYVDADSDGVEDTLDHCLSTPAGENVDSQGCSDSQKDSDYDGVPDSEDLCTGEDDTLDEDEDGVKDCLDQCLNTPEGDIVDSDGCSSYHRTSTIIGIDGGGTETGNGGSILVPENIIVEDTNITVESRADTKLIDEKVTIGKIEFTPSGLNFNSPVPCVVPLSIALTPGKKVAIYLLDEKSNELNRYAYNDGTLSYGIVLDCGKKVAFFIEHFSSYFVSELHPEELYQEEEFYNSENDDRLIKFFIPINEGPKETINGFGSFPGLKNNDYRKQKYKQILKEIFFQGRNQLTDQITEDMKGLMEVIDLSTTVVDGVEGITPIDLATIFQEKFRTGLYLGDKFIGATEINTALLNLQAVGLLARPVIDLFKLWATSEAYLCVAKYRAETFRKIIVGPLQNNIFTFETNFLTNDDIFIEALNEVENEIERQRQLYSKKWQKFITDITITPAMAIEPYLEENFYDLAGFCVSAIYTYLQLSDKICGSAFFPYLVVNSLIISYGDLEQVHNDSIDRVLLSTIDRYAFGGYPYEVSLQLMGDYNEIPVEDRVIVYEALKMRYYMSEMYLKSRVNLYTGDNLSLIYNITNWFYLFFNDELKEEKKYYEDILDATINDLNQIIENKPDKDSDNILDTFDNCPESKNATQEDSDNDQVGDVCDCEPTNPNVYPGASNDTLSPNLSKFQIQNPTVSANENVIIEYQVTDNSALYKIELWETTDSGNQPDSKNWSLVGSDTISGVNHSGTISPDDLQVGNFWYGVHVIDTACNMITEAQPILVSIVEPDDFDNDKDGFTENQGDLNDGDDTIYPGATEIPYDGIDQDCDGGDLTDVDGDSYDAVIVGGDDCNDNNPSINPGLNEICGNDIDENCDGIVEECPVDTDSDGVLDSNDDCPNTPIGESVDENGCSDGQIELDVDNDGDGFSENQRDCNDDDETVYPGALEIVSDDIDHDCDEDPSPDDYSTVKVTVVHSEALLPNEDAKCFIKYNDVIFSEESTDEFGQCEFKISTKNVDTQEKISILVQDSNYNDNEVILDASLSSEIYKRVPLVHLNQKIPNTDNNDCGLNPYSIYYVDALNGNDSNEGCSDTDAWQTLWKVNHADLKPGDIIRFKRGGIWRGTLRAQSGSQNGNYITYTDYGDAILPKPQFLGSINKSSPDDWEYKEGYIWKSSSLQLSEDEILPNNGFDSSNGYRWIKCKPEDCKVGSDEFGNCLEDPGCKFICINEEVDEESGEIICTEYGPPEQDINFHCTCEDISADYPECPDIISDCGVYEDCDANNWYIWGVDSNKKADRTVCGYVNEDVSGNSEVVLRRLNDDNKNWGSIQLWNYNFEDYKTKNPITFGKMYLFSFDAYCSGCGEGMSIDSVELMKSKNIGFDKYGDAIHPQIFSSSSVSNFKITSNIKTYKVLFVAECMATCEECLCEEYPCTLSEDEAICIKSETSLVRGNFFFGEDFPKGASFHIDNVSMREVVNEDFLFQDVGNLIFTDMQQCGFKRFKYNELKNDGDFWFDLDNLELNVYSSKGDIDNPASELNNPANNFQSIECAILDALVEIDPRTDINDDRVSYVIVKNFDLKYAGGHGIKGNRTDHISIQNCDISYVGGKILAFGDNLYPAQTVRYGNGIEIWDIGTDWYIGGNKIWQIYDACVTAQGDGVRFKGTDLKNIFIQNNVLANSEYGFEFWDKLKKALPLNKNIFFENNSVLFSGYSWAHDQRFRNSDLAECWPDECFDCSNGSALYIDCNDEITSSGCIEQLNEWACDACISAPYSDECLIQIANDDKCQDSHGRHFNAWNNYASTGYVSIKNNLFYQAQDVAIYFHDIWYGQENINFDYNMYCQYDDDLETETNLVKILFNDITLYGLNEFYEYQQDTEWDAHSYNCSLPEICDDNPMLSAPDQIKDSEYGFVGFEDEYQILSGSKCIDTGSNDIKNFSGKDVDGNDRDIQNIDIGAFEYQGF